MTCKCLKSPCKIKCDIIKGVEPYSIDHLQCPECDSTYNFGELPIATQNAYKEKINIQNQLNRLAHELDLNDLLLKKNERFFKNYPLK